MDSAMEQVFLAIVVGVLAAIVYTLRVVYAMDKKMSKIMKHLGIHEE